MTWEEYESEYFRCLKTEADLFKLAISLLDKVLQQKNARAVSRFIIQIFRELDTPFSTKVGGNTPYLSEFSELISDAKTAALAKAL